MISGCGGRFLSTGIGRCVLVLTLKRRQKSERQASQIEIRELATIDAQSLDTILIFWFIQPS